jgi:hypothetical protein
MTEGHTRNPAWWFAAAFGVIVAVALAMPAMAGASTMSDPDDVHGKLDVASVTQEHGAVGPVVHTITTYGPWRSRAISIRRGSAFLIGFDTAGGIRAERFALVYRSHGILRVAVLTRNGRELGFGSATRPNLKSIRASIPRKLLGKPNGYRWRLFSVYFGPAGCRAGCVDRAPNSGEVLHDLTAPAVTFPKQGLPASTTTPIGFTVIDKGHSGLEGWTLQGRDVGDTAWTDVATGSASGNQAVTVNGAEGDRRQFQVVARDLAGNVTTSRIRTITFPFDDGNAGMTYTGTWATTGAEALDYLGTLHTSSDPAATVSYGFQGGSVSISARGSCGEASVAIDGGTAQPVAHLCGNEHRAIVFTAPVDPSASHTLVLSITGGTFGFDAIVVR